MRVLITGGAGYVGSHLAENFLLNEHQVCIVDNCMAGNKIPVELRGGIPSFGRDVLNYDEMRRIGERCDLVIHCASVVGVEVVAKLQSKTILTEIRGAENVIKMCYNTGIHKVIYMSTSSVYDGLPSECLRREDQLVWPKTGYSLAKRTAEILFQNSGLDVFCLRLFNVYGGRQDNRMVVSRFIDCMKNKKQIKLFHGGKQGRDFTHISDVVEIVSSLIPRIQGFEIFNICTGVCTSIETLAGMINRISSKGLEIGSCELPSERKDFEVMYRAGDNSKIKNFVHKRDFVSLEDGLRREIQ